ncbi:hypothetical protein Zmor_018456 [Zophobas morio]|nr:hypothetical protein Zmor_018456 [Zophobas morio]
MSNNTVIHFFKINDPNYQNFDWLLSMKLAFMLLDISQRTNPPSELVVIIDMKGVGFMHLTRFKIGAAKTFLEFLQEGMPLKIKMIHIINSNYIFDKILSIARMFIKSELMAMLKSYPADTDITQFQKEHIPASFLPKDYGGDLPSSLELNENTIQQFKELKVFFESEEKLISYYK